MNRRDMVRAALLLPLSGLLLPAARAQAFPSRPLKLVVAFAPGGAGDILARLVAKKLAEGLGQPVVIENRPVPVAAVTAVQQAKPDGYTLLMAGSGTALTSALYAKLPYDLMKDFIHLSTMSSFDLALVSGAESPFRSMADVVAFAKAQPGKLNIATARIGSTQNLTAEMFKAQTGIDAVIVPFKTTGDLVTALRSQDAHVAFEMVPALLGQINGKLVKTLGVTTHERSPVLPSVPTLEESGLKGFESSSWNGLCVPVGTPPDVVDRLAKAIRLAADSPEVQAQYRTLGYSGGGSTPDGMRQRMQADIAKWAGVIQKAGIPQQ
jgi:tripartite-type tricarboxylate transporter receptor subunit TctC